ncbi:hypothetical protein K7A41_00090 [Sphingobacterium sp. InxBP1]|uniref:hypothetical protein n=1 Tax=Sphingobacterium sp. InxBP1 TaxID=2870328 RepID=UPI002243FE3E|nr:hypothetical protein [Sphingobacterium sp. InxBP1]MCW8309625.1 hypothetical protein [Sphingobacterium sp. InxBP1]
MTVFKGYINSIEAYQVDGTDLESKDKDALQIIVNLQFVSEGDITHFVSCGDTVMVDRIYRHLNRLTKLIENYKVRVPQPKPKPSSPPDQPNKKRGRSK